MGSHLWHPEHLFSCPAPQLSAVPASAGRGEVQMVTQWWAISQLLHFNISPKLLGKILAALKERLDKKSTTVKDTGVLAVTFSACTLSVQPVPWRVLSQLCPALSHGSRGEQCALNNISVLNSLYFDTPQTENCLAKYLPSYGKIFGNLQVQEFINLISQITPLTPL